MSRVASVLGASTLAGLAGNLLAVWSVLYVSIVILAATGSGFGAATDATPRSAPWTPSGAFIGGVWTLLYTLMAVALWRINWVAVPVRFPLRMIVLALFAFCIVWPFYAFDTPRRWPGVFGNLGILVLSITAVTLLWRHSISAALAIAPTAVWILIATAAILDGARRYGW